MSLAPPTSGHCPSLGQAGAYSGGSPSCPDVPSAFYRHSPFRPGGLLWTQSLPLLPEVSPDITPVLFFSPATVASNVKQALLGIRNMVSFFSFACLVCFDNCGLKEGSLENPRRAGWVLPWSRSVQVKPMRLQVHGGEVDSAFRRVRKMKIRTPWLVGAGCSSEPHVLTAFQVGSEGGVLEHRAATHIRTERSHPLVLTCP